MTRPRSRFAVISCACAALAVALRAWHLGHGLPELTEEAFPFRRALAMWGTGSSPPDLDPHWFLYPSLTLYLQLGIQWVCFHASSARTVPDLLLSLAVDPSMAIVPGRLVSVAADAASVILAGRITRRYGELPATLSMLLVAFAPAMIATSRLIYADSVLCALSLAAILALLGYARLGGLRRLLVAAALVGIAAGAKYPGCLLLVPLLFAIAVREPRPRNATRALAAIAVAAFVFLATTPYLIASWSEVAGDLGHIRDTISRGNLGATGGVALPAYTLEFARDLGWAGTILVLASGLAAWRGRCRHSTRLLWLTGSVSFVPVALVPVLAERYLVPSIAIGACLAAAGLADATRRLRLPSRRWSVAALVIVVLAQPAWEGFAAARLGRSTTQLEVSRWCRAHVGDRELILSEAYGPALMDRRQKTEMMSSALFLEASPETRARYASLPAYHLVWMPLLIGGYASVRLPVPGSPEVEVYPHAVDWNAAAYDLRLLRGVDYVITTGAVRGRFEADTARFGEQAHFYAALDGLAGRVAVFAPDREIEGPRIAIYRPTPRLREAISARGPLDSLWWARTVPDAYRTASERALRAAAPGAALVPGLPLWVEPLRSAYRQRYGPFANDLTANLIELGDLEPARELAIASLTIAPDDANAARAYVQACRGLCNWSGAGPVLERAMRAQLQQGEVPPDIQLGYAEAQLEAGDVARGERLLDVLAATGDPTVASAARALRSRHPR